MARCKTYNPAELVPALQKMFDQLGGLGRLVKGKTVAIKINLTGSPTYRLGYLPLEDTHYTHPQVIAATVHLLGKAGARRIRMLESPWSTADPVEEYLLRANWEPRDILGAAPNVEFENTNYLGHGQEILAPAGAVRRLHFPGVRSEPLLPGLRRLRQHRQDEGARHGGRHALHEELLRHHALHHLWHGRGHGRAVGDSQGRPRHGAQRESRSRRRARRRRRIRNRRGRTPSACRARWWIWSPRGPIHLAIVEGIRTMTGGEGPWIREDLTAGAPGVMVAGLNPVNTDAVAMSVMGFDPMADRGTPPFERCDSTLKLAEEAGLGTRDLQPHRSDRAADRGSSFRLRRDSQSARPAAAAAHGTRG